MLDALYQAYCSQLPNTGVALPLSPTYYTNNDSNNTLSFSYRETRLVFKRTLYLAWAHERSIDPPLQTLLDVMQEPQGQ